MKALSVGRFVAFCAAAAAAVAVTSTPPALDSTSATCQAGYAPAQSDPAQCAPVPAEQVEQQIDATPQPRTVPEEECGPSAGNSDAISCSTVEVAGPPQSTLTH